MSDIANGQLVAGSGTADDDDDNFASIRLFLGDALTADNASIPDKTATPGKVSLPYDSGTDTQATEVLVDAYERMLSIPPKKARKSCAGRWDADEQHLVAVARPVDAIARTSGKPHSGITYLDPEEWLLFYERGSLEIRDNQTQIKRSLADVWTRAVDSPQFKLPGFRAYAILRRLGYVVVCVPSGNFVCNTPVSSVDHGFPKAHVGIEAYSYANVFYGLLQRAPLSTHPNPSCTGGSISAKNYSVYKPNANYRKRDQPTPQHTLVVQSSTDSLPSVDTFVHWEHANHELSTLFSVSEPGSTGFLSVRPIEIQDLQN